MKWNLWIDDVRDPHYFLKERADGELPENKFRFYLNLGMKADDFVWCLNCDEAIAKVKELGVPTFMALDHDLGLRGNTMEFLKWLANEYPESPPLHWFSHSGNKSGALNMDSFMTSWILSLSLPSLTVHTKDTFAQLKALCPDDDNTQVETELLDIDKQGAEVFIMDNNEIVILQTSEEAIKAEALNLETLRTQSAMRLALQDAIVAYLRTTRDPKCAVAYLKTRK